MQTGTRAALLALAATAVTATAPAARTAEPTLLCARDEVLRIVDRTIRQWNRYNRIVDGTASEAPTERADAVVCFAVMRSVAYVLTPEGWLPRTHEALRRYDVQVVANRLFVQVEPWDVPAPRAW